VCGLVAGFSIHRSNRLSASRAMVEKIEGAAIEELPPLLRQVRTTEGIVPLLVAAKQNAIARSNENRQFNLNLALSQHGHTETAYFVQRLVDSEIRDIPRLAMLIGANATQIKDALWTVLEEEYEDYSRPQQLKAAIALCELVPSETTIPRWTAVARRIGHLLIAQMVDEPHLADSWTIAFKPLASSFSPMTMAAGQAHTDRNVAATAARAVAVWNRDDPTFLALLACRLSPTAFAACREILMKDSEQLVEELSNTYNQRLPVRTQYENYETFSQQHGLTAEHIARVVAILFQLGDQKSTWELLSRHDTDPVLRDCLILKLSTYGSDFETLYNRLHLSTSSRETSSLIRVLSRYSKTAASDTKIIPELTRRMQSDPNALVHTMSEWVLLRRRVGVDKIKRALTLDPDGQAAWYVDRSLQTMVIFSGPGETTTSVRAPSFDHRYAMSAHEISVAAYQWFGNWNNPNWKVELTGVERPQVGVTWYEAAEFCNRLSERAKIPRDQWCYLPNDANRFAAGTRIAPGAINRTGYRLPTEAEWMHACGNNSDGRMPWGNSASLCHVYAWPRIDGGKSATDMFPTGLKHPNDAGLFDMCGNAAEWCHQRIDNETSLEVNDETQFVLRGGSTRNSCQELSRIPRQLVRAADPIEFAGFRVVRTLKK
jgi:formylglycine-generating enzyme required for sulfatase activity